MTEISVIGQRTEIPADHKCEICHVNDLKYYQKEKHVCLYCWTRVAYINLQDKTDEEINLIRNSNKDNMRKLIY